MEPAPNGNLWKRRKVEHDEAAPGTALIENLIKEENSEDNTEASVAVNVTKTAEISVDIAVGSNNEPVSKPETAVDETMASQPTAKEA